MSHPRDKSLECLTSCYIAYHLLFTTFWSVLYFALFGPQASKFAKSDGAGVPAPGQLEAKIFTFLFFARKKYFFQSKVHTRHPNFDIWTDFEKSIFSVFGRFFHFFSVFWPPRPRKSLSPAGGSGPGPSQLKAEIFKIVFFAEKTLFFG